MSQEKKEILHHEINRTIRMKSDFDFFLVKGCKENVGKVTDGKTELTMSIGLDEVKINHPWSS